MGRRQPIWRCCGRASMTNDDRTTQPPSLVGCWPKVSQVSQSASRASVRWLTAAKQLCNGSLPSQAYESQQESDASLPVCVLVRHQQAPLLLSTSLARTSKSRRESGCVARPPSLVMLALPAADGFSATRIDQPMLVPGRPDRASVRASPASLSARMLTALDPRAITLPKPGLSGEKQHGAHN